jgi:hypothetical protein
MDCEHKETEVWTSHCSGLDLDNLEATQIIRCKDCGWTWRIRHKGHYVKDTDIERLPDAKIKYADEETI